MSLDRGPHRRRARTAIVVQTSDLDAHATRRPCRQDARSRRAASRARRCSRGRRCPSSKPAMTASRAGARRRTSGTRRRGARRCGVDDHVVGDVAEQPTRARPTHVASRERDGDAASASVACVERGPGVGGAATRMLVRTSRRPTGTTTGAGLVDDRARLVLASSGEVVGDEVGAGGGEAARARRRPPAARTSSATSCACGCAIDAPAARPVVHERLHVRVAGVERGDGPGRAAREHLGGLRRR